MGKYLTFVNRVTNIMTEIWRRHPVYSEFEISDAGRVRRIFGGRRGASVGRILKGSLDHGYRYIRPAGHGRMRFIHVLVLEAFVGPSGEDEWCRHLNGVKTDNRLANLRWGTASENYADSVRHGTAARGIRHPRAKLNEKQVYEIRQMYFGGNITQRALAKEYGLNHSTVQSLLEYRTWQGVR